MKITKCSTATGKVHTREIDISPDQYETFRMGSGGHIQDMFPHLSASDREFLLSGTTDEEWNELMRDDEDDEPQTEEEENEMMGEELRESLDPDDWMKLHAARLRAMPETPQTPRCRCNCGYRCGGPGTCELDVMECLQQDDGKHYVRDCDHKWDGPMQWIEYPEGGSSGSVTCSVCGMSAMDHDAVVGP